MKAQVKVSLHARSAWPFLPVTAPPGSWWIGPLGELVQVLEDGTVDLLPTTLPHCRGAAADPCNAPG